MKSSWFWYILARCLPPTSKQLLCIAGYLQSYLQMYIDWRCHICIHICNAGTSFCTFLYEQCVFTRGGHVQLFFESAIATPQLEGSTSASQFRNFLKNVAPQPQLRNSAIVIFSEVLNFKSATWELHFRNSWQIFGIEQLEIIYFLPPGVFLLLRGF